MGTTFDFIIEDHCLVMVDDYKLTALYGKPGWNEYVDGFLFVAINRFKPYCDNLEIDTTPGARAFVNELSATEIQMLALYWIIAWARREVNNSSQLQLKLKVASGFSFSSEGSTLKAKQLWLDVLEEEAGRILTQYQLGEGMIGSYNW